MPHAARRLESGFTLVELTIVLVIGVIVLTSVYQTVVTQERAQRHNAAAADAQGTSRTGIQLLTAELREASTAAGADPNGGGSDLLVTTADSIRLRAFRKLGVTCVVDVPGHAMDVWVLGAAFVTGDTILVFEENSPGTRTDDIWAPDIAVSWVGSSNNTTACQSEWPGYPIQRLRGPSDTHLQRMKRGGLVRSYDRLTYGIYQVDGQWVVGRRNSSGAVVPLVGPVLPPADGGLRFRYFDAAGAELTPTTETGRAQIARVEIIVRAVGRGARLNNRDLVDSITTSVHLRGN